MKVTHVLKDGTIHSSIDGKVLTINNSTLSIYSIVKEVFWNIKEREKKLSA